MSGEALQRLYEKWCSSWIQLWNGGFKEVSAVVYTGTQVQHRPAETEAIGQLLRGRDRLLAEHQGRMWVEEAADVGGCLNVAAHLFPLCTNRTLQVLVRPALLPTGACADLLKLIPCKEKAMNQQLFKWLHTARLGGRFWGLCAAYLVLMHKPQGCCCRVKKATPQLPLSVVATSKKKNKKNTQLASTEIYLSELKLTVVTGGTGLTNIHVALKIEPLPVSL